MDLKRYRRTLIGALLMAALLTPGILCRADAAGMAPGMEENPEVELEWVADNDGAPQPPDSDAVEIELDDSEGAWIDIGDELDPEADLTLNDDLSGLLSGDVALELDLTAEGNGAPFSGESGYDDRPCSYCPGAGMSSERAMSGYIHRAMYGGTGTSGALARNGSVGTRLKGVEGRLYTLLRQRVEAVARGDLANTEFSLNIRDLYDDVAYTAADLGAGALTDANGDITLQAAFSFWIRVSIDVGKVIDALLADCPYDLYWYDKTSPTWWNNVTYEVDGDCLRIKDYAAGAMCFHFPVAAEYSVSGTTGTCAVDTGKGRAVQAAAENARKIVEDNRSLGDLEKLTAYKDAICDLVAYNHGAASGEIRDYGNPWQLVWVFDGDPGTNVVCEGYSKAFQYLCELSAFRGNVSAIIVTGYIDDDRDGGGRHMWNQVNIGDVCYLADITNCDEGSVGWPDRLFMKGYSYAMLEDWGEVYFYHVGSRTIHYYFDTEIKNLFSAGELGICDDPVGPDVGGQTSGTAGALTWKLDKYGVLYVTGSGAIPDYSEQDKAPWAGEKVERAYLSGGVTAIGDRAFIDCPNLTLVALNTGITRIGRDVFDVDKLRGQNVQGIIIPKCTEKAVIDYVNDVKINHSITSHGKMTYIVTRAATCVSTGREYARCEGCGEEFEWDTPKDPSNHAQIVTDAAIPATCTLAGKTEGRHCSACQTVIEAQGDVAAKGHTAVVDPAVPATVESTGLTEGKHCSVCGEVLVARQVTPKLPKPTAAPTVESTAAPTAKPTAAPTVEPTAAPTVEPTAAPSVEPTAAPTESPGPAPTATPVSPISLANAKIAVKPQAYTGKALKPSVSVTLNRKQLKKGTDYSVSYKNNKKIGTAVVTITGRGRYTDSAKAGFRINPKPVTGLKLKASVNRISVSWKKVPGVGGYQLQYGLKKDFKAAKKATVAKAATVKKDLTDLQKGKFYYVRVRAYKKVDGKHYWSAWSAARKVRVK